VTLAVLLAIGFFLGVFGIPQLNSVDNEFGTVNETTTEIETSVNIYNPNPIGVSFGGLQVNYTVNMNDIPMANGQKKGLSIATGNSSLGFTTYLDNTRIPEWWYTHIRNGERTDLTIDAQVSHSALGGTDFQQGRTVETDILSAFDSTETREVDANAALVEDPVLYINETEGSYGTNVTRERTPIDLDFTVYNPKRVPYTVTEVGYTINMNNITVGEGATQSERILPPQEETSLVANTAIDNSKLDQWWVSHLQNGETTDLYIDFYVQVDPGVGEPIRLDSEELDYRTTIETNILGSGGTNASAGSSGASGSVAAAT
jgi:LEA14-like dessication related protein